MSKANDIINACVEMNARTSSNVPFLIARCYTVLYIHKAQSICALTTLIDTNDIMHIMHVSTCACTHAYMHGMHMHALHENIDRSKSTRDYNTLYISAPLHACCSKETRTTANWHIILLIHAWSIYDVYVCMPHITSQLRARLKKCTHLRGAAMQNRRGLSTWNAAILLSSNLLNRSIVNPSK